MRDFRHRTFYEISKIMKKIFRCGNPALPFFAAKKKIRACGQTLRIGERIRYGRKFFDN